MISRRGVGLTALVALGAGLLAGAVAVAQGGGRIVRGQVLDEKGETVAQAIVHLKNKSTNDTVTMVANGEGRFQFNDVDMKGDYKIHAELKGKKSRQRSISQFDTRPIVVVNLRLKAAKEKAEKSENKEREKD
jgi:hypothetical protein